VFQFDLLLVATRPLFDALGLILLLAAYVVVIPLAYIVELLVYFLLSLAEPALNRGPPEPPQPGDLADALQRLLSMAIPPELLLGLKATGAAVILLFMLLAIARALARWRPPSAEAHATQEERDSLWHATRLWQAVRAWLRSMFGRDRRARAEKSLVPASEVRAALADGSSVRELYRELLRLGEVEGARRPASATPLEHLPLLRDALQPESGPTELTAAYNEARYAEREPPPAEAAQLRQSLASLRPRQPDP
jgi:hypothetical protein